MPVCQPCPCCPDLPWPGAFCPCDDLIDQAILIDVLRDLMDSPEDLAMVAAVLDLIDDLGETG
ncbi:MAG: hypothetical protein HFJ75_01615 [Eggerthellaceae bacterium]|nr:hypothetical protein [Eggerthellaceae bacterium]